MSEWIEWDRCGAPVMGCKVDVRLKDGQEVFNRPSSDYAWRSGASWITHYRLSEKQSMEEAYEQTHKEIGDSALEQQHGGDHYKKLGDYQPWEVLRHWLTPEEFRGYMKGEAITYLARERSKGGTLDINKAAHTLKALLELEGK